MGSRPGDGARNRSVPGLDGLRGIAVLAVMAFHFGVAAAAGGLLGVDVFFVLSGFLVTSLLLLEHDRTGTVRLGGFWARRARRLLPALFITLIGIAAYARWVGGGLSPVKLRGDALSTLFYVANWHFVITGQNYFIKYGAQSPLLHTWSLAVEEQFYLVWPVVVLLVLRRFGRGGLRWVAGTLATCSAAVCAVLYLNGASVDRLYYGTDTRAQALMVGALLAVIVPMSRVSNPGPEPSRRSSGSAGRPPGQDGGGAMGRKRVLSALWLAAGYAGAAGLAYCLHAVQGNGGFLYEGGFLAVAAATAAIVAVTVRQPESVLSRFLSLPALRYVGRISYGLYLYHWPIFLVIDGARTGLSGIPLLVVRFGATFAVAVASYHLIEDPVRSRRWPKMRAWRVGKLRRPLTSGVALTAASLLVVGAAFAFGIPRESSQYTLAASSVPPPGYVAPSGASAANPVHAVLIGDSIAVTLGWGLTKNAPAWGVTVDNAASIGCDLDPGTIVNVMGTISPTANGCPHWRSTWTQLVARTNPDVVVVLLGRWECLDRKFGGKWTHVGEPGFDQHLQAELGQVIDIGASHGAKVVFLTLPYIAQTTEQPDGAPWDMNLPSRTDAYNADVRAAVARQPDKASIIDLNKMLDPGGHYASVIDGVRVRNYDQEHLSVQGGEWLRPQLLPRLAQLGAAHFRSRTATLASS